MIRLSLSVSTDDGQIVAKAAEQFARTAAGLALDGVDCMLMVGPDFTEEEDE